MGEFDDFAADLGRQHDEKQNSFDAEQQKRRDDRNHLAAVGRLYLEAHVLPIFDDARRAFEAKGLRVEIGNTWDKQSPLGPGVSFQVFGQKKRAVGEGAYETGGDIAGVLHDGNALSATLAPHRHNAFPGRTKVGDDLAAVREAVKRAASSLYEALDPTKP